MKPSTLFTKALKVLEKSGWCQNKYADAEKRCILGCLLEAHVKGGLETLKGGGLYNASEPGTLPFAEHEIKETGAIDFLHCAVYGNKGKESQWSRGYNISLWNDAPGRRVTDVKKALQKAQQLAKAAGK